MRRKGVQVTKTELKTTFKNMSPAMKRAVAFTTLMGVICLGMVAVFIVPQLKKMSSLSDEFEQVDTAFSLLHKNISEIGKLRTEVAEAEKILAETTSASVLEPLLGSYEMRALKFLTPLAQKTGVILMTDSVRCLSVLPIKLAETIRVGRFYARQPIEFGGKGSYIQIIAFIKAIESEMPWVSVSSLRIVGQQSKPEEHIMLISLEWPVFAESTPVAKEKGAQ